MPPKTPERLTIGKVLAAMREDFPDITISKIRFLESAGLLTPERTPAGYRVYAATDLERLRYILRAQQEWFWPLKVIREALDALDRGLTPTVHHAEGARPRPPAPSTDPALPSVGDLEPDRTIHLTRDELIAAAELDPDVAASLESFGLLRPDDEGHYGAADLQAAAAAAKLAAYGIEARHLRPFRTAADREIGLIEQAMSTSPEAAKSRDEAAIAHACLQLHAALVKGGLGRR